MKKTIILTGASKGIGKAAATLLEDCNLVLTARDEEKLKNLANTINSAGKSRAIYVKADIKNEEEIKSVISKTVEVFGPPDVLINNAGTGQYKRCDEFTREEFLEIYTVNMLGTFLFTKHALPYMIDRKSGQVINIASVAGLNGFKHGTAYSSSKFAMIGFTESLREDVKEYGIAVSAICPGAVLTEFGGKDIESKKQAEYILEPEDVARSIRYLVEESETANTKLIELKPRRRKEYR